MKFRRKGFYLNTYDWFYTQRELELMICLFMQYDVEELASYYLNVMINEI